MATWIVGDIHGCSRELAELIGTLGLGQGDTLVSCGDLFHRGPDPMGVLEILRGMDAKFILGNHERAILERYGLVPESPLHKVPDIPPSHELDLAGDGRRPLLAPLGREREFVEFLMRSSGYWLGSRNLQAAGPTPDGRDWLTVHAGLESGLPIQRQRPEHLVSLRRLPLPGRPWWYEDWRGPELVIFGHTPSRVPRVHRVDGKLVALGIDTGCVYGGALTAYCPELDVMRHVRAEEAYATQP